MVAGSCTEPRGSAGACGGLNVVMPGLFLLLLLRRRILLLSKLHQGSTPYQPSPHCCYQLGRFSDLNMRCPRVGVVLEHVCYPQGQVGEAVQPVKVDY